VASIFHDLRQSVAAGILLAETLRPSAVDAAPKETIETLQHLLWDMHDLLAVPGNLPRKRACPADRVDLGVLAARCVQLVRLTQDVTVHTDLQPVLVHGDPVLLRRAIANLLDNATRAAGPHGSVTVRVRQSGSDSLVEVADDGVGFGRLPTVNGQGLSIVDSALRACRGGLEISSGPEPGTTVRLRIPTQRSGGKS